MLKDRDNILHSSTGIQQFIRNLIGLDRDIKDLKNSPILNGM